MASINPNIKCTIEGIDDVIEKANQLNALLKETAISIDSLLNKFTNLNINCDATVCKANAQKSFSNSWKLD